LIPSDTQLKALLPSCAIQTLGGFFYRGMCLTRLFGFHLPLLKRYAPNPLYDKGSCEFGARFTPCQPLGGISSLYFAETIQTAYDEANRVRDGFDPFANPTVLISLEVSVTKMLDLTHPAVLTTLGIQASDLIQGWRIAQKNNGIAPTQRLGQCAFECGIQALRYPSVQSPGGICYVVYTDTVVPSSQDKIDVMDANKQFAMSLP